MLDLLAFDARVLDLLRLLDRAVCVVLMKDFFEMARREKAVHDQAVDEDRNARAEEKFVCCYCGCG
ncbi:hypothetical protein M3J09_011488 [Ascochyta lentis]